MFEHTEPAFPLSVTYRTTVVDAESRFGVTLEDFDFSELIESLYSEGVYGLVEAGVDPDDPNTILVTATVVPPVDPEELRDLLDAKSPTWDLVAHQRLALDVEDYLEYVDHVHNRIMGGSQGL